MRIFKLRINTFMTNNNEYSAIIIFVHFNHRECKKLENLINYLRETIEGLIEGYLPGTPQERLEM